jgi:hypothetical protein
MVWRNFKRVCFRLFKRGKIKKIDIFDIGEINSLKNRWLRDGTDTNKIWLLLIFIMWYEKWIEK